MRSNIPNSIGASHNKGKDFDFRNACPEIPNTTYLTHGLHSYPAKFIPHIPRWFLRKYAGTGEIVLDPFCGSGTALVEANMLGMHALGVDINPMSPLLVRAKTETVRQPDEFSENCLDAVRRATEHPPEYLPDIPNIEIWFLPQAREELARIFGYLISNPDGLSGAERDFLLVCASACVRRVCNADPRISKPFISRHMRARLADNMVEQRALRVFEEVTRRFLGRKMKYVRHITNLAKVWGFQPGSRHLPDSDARTLDGVEDGSVDAIITSPPYANAQEYFRSVKLELYWLGLAPKGRLAELNRALVGTERLKASECVERPVIGISGLDEAMSRVHSVDRKRAHIVMRYFRDMRISLEQCYRVLKPGGYLGLLVGDNVIRKVPVSTHEHMVQIAERVGFTTIDVGYDRIVARSLNPIRNESAGLIDVEWMLVFRKMGFSG